MRTWCLLAFVCSAGCFVADPTPTGGPPPTPAPTPTSTPTYRIALGASTFISPGQQAGYSLTASGGHSYRLVWTGDANTSGSYHEFTGAISVGGHFVSTTPGCSDGSCPLESNDWISAPTSFPGGEQITFDTFATVGIDGLDFVVDAEPITLDLQIDGTSYPDLAFFTAAGSGAVTTPASIPFNISP